VTDISLIKMEAVPFDRGAQRQIYRLKKISQAPTVNWRKIDWAHAPNYVAKSYLTADGSIGTDDKIRCFNDVRLQYEAAHWANIFNRAGPPKAIHVIQCYVLELNSRPGSPVVGCERFVDGHDKYGAGFVKHNSNSGFVDAEENRATPQAFSAHSFYASAGKLMVVDVQGVGDLYTDPQVTTVAKLSSSPSAVDRSTLRMIDSEILILGSVAWLSSLFPFEEILFVTF
jgi:elongation factor 2 kinase